MFRQLGAVVKERELFGAGVWVRNITAQDRRLREVDTPLARYVLRIHRLLIYHQLVKLYTNPHTSMRNYYLP